MAQFSLGNLRVPHGKMLPSTLTELEAFHFRCLLECQSLPVVNCPKKQHHPCEWKNWILCRLADLARAEHALRTDLPSGLLTPLGSKDGSKFAETRGLRALGRMAACTSPLRQLKPGSIHSKTHRKDATKPCGKDGTSQPRCQKAEPSCTVALASLWLSGAWHH